ncbi:MAG: radical SAM protein [Pseudomonadota bacterium]
MKPWLIYPPFADPTQPYLSLPYLKGYLRSRGLDAEVADLNLSATHYLLSPAQMADNAGRLAERFADLNRHDRIGGMDQLAYLAMAEARPAAVRSLASPGTAIKTLQDSRNFYHSARYRQSRNQIEDALSCLSALHYPYHFHFNRASHTAVPWGIDLLESYFRNRKSPLDAFYRDLLDKQPLLPGQIVGISLTFISQIPETFYLLHLLRQRCPKAFLVLGGTCVQYILRHAPTAVQKQLLDLADAACLSEGEETLVQLVRALAALGSNEDAGSRFHALREIPNLLLREPDTGKLHTGPAQTTDIAHSPLPDYADLDLDSYLAPSRTLLFAPTRGCYWNRCSFCDYGLNRSGNHDYREMEAAEAAQAMAGLAETYNVRNFYLSVDVLSPKFAISLARELIARKTDISWSADFRIEPYYTPERCRLLYRSGLRAVAFGIESGSDELLKHMHKGITTKQIRVVNDAFHNAGIATAWMAFTDHPGEKKSQLQATLKLINSQLPSVDLFILGRFGLTGGSDIAACPEKYGLSRIFFCRGDDFRLFPLYETRSQKTGDSQYAEDEIARLSSMYYLDHYPWNGAISTHHSFLYILRYGQDVFRDLPTHELRLRDVPKNGRMPRGLTVPPAFPLGRMARQRSQFMEGFRQRALKIQDNGQAPLDEAFFNDFLEKEVKSFRKIK